MPEKSLHSAEEDSAASLKTLKLNSTGSSEMPSKASHPDTSSMPPPALAIKDPQVASQGTQNSTRDTTADSSSPKDYRSSNLATSPETAESTSLAANAGSMTSSQTSTGVAGPGAPSNVPPIQIFEPTGTGSQVAEEDGAPVLLSASTSTPIMTTTLKSSVNSESLKKKSPLNMTLVETERVPAVSTIGTNSDSTGANSSSLKIKKSTDNVATRNLSRTKKKRSSRFVGSKAEMFAAKIASAVDENAQSSDSDETFVYESQPSDSNGPAAGPAGSSLLNGRALSLSKNNLSRQRSLRSLQPGSSRRHSPSGSAHEHSQQSQHTASASQYPNRAVSPSISRTHTNQEAFAPPPSVPSRKLPNQNRIVPRTHSYTSTNNQERPNLLNKPSSNSIYGSNRWRYVEEDDDDYDEMTADEIEPDEDEYALYNETTPLQQAKAPSIRRARKGNGGMVVYSPHNYSRKTPSRYYYMRLALWFTFGLFSVMVLGFVFGFLIATSKPLAEVEVTRIFEVIVSDEELAFEMVIEGINPGFLGIEVVNTDLDVFAKSPYVDDSKTSLDDSSSTMLIGKVTQFDAPITFEGSLFNRRMQKLIADVRLASPISNSTSPSDPGADPNKGKPSGGDGKDGGSHDDPNDPDEPDDEQDPAKRWNRVTAHPFDLIVRGVFKYELLFGQGSKAAILSKSVRVDPNAPE